MYGPQTLSDRQTKVKYHRGAPRTKRIGLVSEDGLEDTHKWIRELVFKVILRVDRDVVLEHVYWVFGFLVRSRT